VMAKANRDSINVKGAFAHIVTDLYAFIGTLVAGIVIITTGFERADSITVTTIMPSTTVTPSTTGTATRIRRAMYPST